MFDNLVAIDMYAHTQMCIFNSPDFWLKDREMVFQTFALNGVSNIKRQGIHRRYR